MGVTLSQGAAFEYESAEYRRRFGFNIELPHGDFDLIKVECLWFQGDFGPKKELSYEDRIVVEEWFVNEIKGSPALREKIRRHESARSS